MSSLHETSLASQKLQVVDIYHTNGTSDADMLFRTLLPYQDSYLLTACAAQHNIVESALLWFGSQSLKPIPSAATTIVS